MRGLTFGGDSRFAVWSLDGKKIAFQGNRDDKPGLFVQTSDGPSTCLQKTVVLTSMNPKAEAELVATGN